MRIILVALIMFTVYSANSQNVVNPNPVEASFEKEKLDEDSLDEKYVFPVQGFINAIKKGKREIAGLIYYPLDRQYPIPPINNEQELLERYNEIFDDKLISMITTSNPYNDWHAVGWRGWRGIMLNNGDLWLDYNGDLIAVNYMSESEQRLRYNLIEGERQSLHKSIRNYENPVLIMETEKYRIRMII